MQDSRSTRRHLAVQIIGLALVVAACGGGGDDSGDSSANTEALSDEASPSGGGDDAAQPEIDRLASTFDSDDDGWTTAGDADGLRHFAVGGNPGGYVGSSDLSEGVTWFFVSPAGWAGDRAGFVGGALRYDLVIDRTDDWHVDDDVVLQGAGRRLGFRHGEQMTTDWTTYAVPLVDEFWIDLDSGAAAGSGSLDEVLGDLDELWIRGEHRRGADVASLDNVVLSTDPVASGSADTAADGSLEPVIDVVGVWSSDYGDVTIGADGVYVAGTYGSDGAIVGELDGVILTGYWVGGASAVVCDEPRAGFDRWGQIVWTFDDDATRFDGVWGYCADELDAPWNGTRISDGSNDLIPLDSTGDRAPDPPLVSAVFDDDLAAVEALLAAGEDPNVAQESDGWSPLLVAAQEGHTDIARALVDAGADIDRGTDDDWTALMIAAQNGHDETLAYLLEAGANVRVARSDNWTALHSAVTREHIGATRLLIEAGSPLEAARAGFTPLTYAAQDGADAFATLLIDAGARLAGSPADGPSPLYMASQNDHGSLAQLLLDAGADPDDGGNTASPIYIASQNGHVEIVQLLLGAGADPDDGGTADAPIIQAAAKRRIEIVPVLVDGGADVDIRGTDRGAWTALMWAANNNDADMIAVLLGVGADPALTDADDRTALQIAQRLDNAEAVAALS